MPSSVRFGFLLLLVATALMGETSDSTRALEALQIQTQELRRVRIVAGHAEIGRRLQERAQNLTLMMHSRPAEAASMLLTPAEQQQFREAIPSFSPFIESSGVWQGTLHQLVADDFENHVARTYYGLGTQEGNLAISFARPPSEIDNAGRILVQGTRLGEVVLAESVEVLEPRQASSPCCTEGEQKVVVILVNFRSLHLSVSPATVQSAFFDKVNRSVDGYWRDASSGRAFASGTVVGPYDLATDYTCDQASAIEAAAIKAADKDVDFTRYSRVFIVMPSPPGCGWIGLALVGCSMHSSNDGAFTSSTAWIVGNSDPVRLAAVAAHEGGHNLGLNHARSLAFSGATLGVPGATGIAGEYGDPYSVMGSYLSFGHYSAPHKAYLGWLQASNIQNVEADGVFTLAPFESQMSAVQALRVRRGTNGDQWLWLEYRQPLGYDTSIGSGGYAGVTIHYEDPAITISNPYTYLLDFSPTTATFGDAVLTAGAVWSDPYSTLKILVGSKIADGITVSVSYSTPCATIHDGSRTYSSESASGSFAVSAASACTWSVSSGASWITLSSASTGKGSGNVEYSIAANTSTTLRTGAIFVGLNKFTIEQAGQPLVGPVVPSSGTGSSQVFTFSYSDSIDYTNLVAAEMIVNSSIAFTKACYARLDVGQRSITLRDDSNGSWIGPISIGANGFVENGQCIINAGGSSMNGSARTLAVELAITFKASFQGVKSIYSRTQTVGYMTGWKQQAVWAVNCAPNVSFIAPAVGSGINQTFAFTIANRINATRLKVNINSSNSSGAACMIYVETASGLAVLANDAGSQYGPTVLLGGSGVLENSQCRLSAAGSSSATNGDNLTIRLDLGFKSGFSGNKNMYVSVSGPNLSTDWQRRGAWAVTGFGSGAANPDVGSVTPATGGGAVQIFRGQYTSGIGRGGLRWLQLLFAADASGGGQPFCFLHYDVRQGTFWLYSDDVGYFQGPIPPGAESNRLQSSTCALNPAASLVDESAGSLSVDFALVFKRSLNQNIYMRALAMDGTDTGWQARGVWSQTATPLALLSSTPNSGGGSSQVFRLSFEDPAGMPNPGFGWVQFLLAVDPSGGGKPFCFLHYDRAGDGLWMYSSDVGFFLGPVVPGTSSSLLRTTACSIATSGVVVRRMVGSLQLDVPLTSDTPMSGRKGLFLRSYDSLQRDSGWIGTGSWLVP